MPHPCHRHRNFVVIDVRSQSRTSQHHDTCPMIMAAGNGVCTMTYETHQTPPSSCRIPHCKLWLCFSFASNSKWSQRDAQMLSGGTFTSAQKPWNSGGSTVPLKVLTSYNPRHEESQSQLAGLRPSYLKRG
eukprot:916839-Rhodomonas_salina.2